MRTHAFLFCLATATTIFACSALPNGDGRTPSYAESEVAFDSGELRLGGLLFMPKGSGPFPGAVIIPGSGDSDRNNRWARSFVHALASNGIAVLLPDKRGNGASGGDWRQADFHDYAADASAAVDFLESRAAVARGRVGVVGLSQGGHVAPLAGSRDPGIAFVVNISGSATTPVEQVNHEMKNTFRQAGLDEDAVAAGMELQRMAEHYVRTDEWEPYASAMSAALATPLRPVAEGFPQEPDSWVWSWWRAVGDFDPIVHWRALTQPALVVYGAGDELDNVPVAESIERLGPLESRSEPPLRVIVYQESGHAIYTPGTHDVRPELLDLLVDWIKSHS